MRLPARLGTPLCSRALVTASLLAFVTACGGGGDSPAAPPGNPGGNPGGNPPPIGPPVSLSIDAGDAQVAEPNVTLTTPISATVRDSGGRAVANAVVSFTVDSGGGSVATATATAGSDGRVTSGAWTMGAAEGPQVLRLTAGAASAKVRATARVTPRTLGVQTVATGGGTIVINDAGSAINGLRMVIAADAYQAAKNVTIAYTSAATVTPPAGSTVVSPLLTVSGLEERARKEIELTIPALTPAGQTPMVLLRDPTSLAQTTARLVSWTSTSVTVAVHRFDGPELAAVPPSAVSGVLTAMSQANALSSSRTRTSRTAPSSRLSASVTPPPGPAQVYVVTIPDSEIFKDRASGFSVSDDGWNFAAVPTIATPLTQVGMATTAHYWATIYGAGGRSLRSGHWFGDAALESVPLANRKALRLVSLASLATVSTDVTSLRPQQTATADWAFRSIAANMIVSGGDPVPVLLESANTIRMVLVISILANGGMSVYDPLAGNTAAGLLVFNTNYQLSGYVAPGQTALTALTRIVPGSAYEMYDKREMTVLLSTIGNSNFGDAQFPQTELRSHFDIVASNATPIWVMDTITVWSHCPSCTGMGTPASFTPDPMPANGEVLPSWFYVSAASGSTLTAPGGNTTADLRGGFRLNRNVPNPARAVFVNMGTCGGATGYVCWIDAHDVKQILRADVHALGPSGAVTPDSLVTMNATLGVRPTNAELEWDYDDGTPRENKGAVTVTTHKFANNGTYTVRARLYHPTTRQVVAIDSFTVDVQGCASTFVDARDGYRYQQVCLGAQTWMAENLQFNVPGSICYENLTANCTKYGRLYTRPQALAGNATSVTMPSGIRGACPAGWHVPSVAEWTALANRYGGLTAAEPALRSQSDWLDVNPPATNQSGMNILGGGARRGASFINRQRQAWLYTTDPSNNTYITVVVTSPMLGVLPQHGWNDEGYSLRCVKD